MHLYLYIQIANFYLLTFGNFQVLKELKKYSTSEKKKKKKKFIIYLNERFYYLLQYKNIPQHLYILHYIL